MDANACDLSKLTSYKHGGQNLMEHAKSSNLVIH